MKRLMARMFFFTWGKKKIGKYIINILKLINKLKNKNF